MLSLTSCPPAPVFTWVWRCQQHCQVQPGLTWSDPASLMTSLLQQISWVSSEPSSLVSRVMILQLWWLMDVATYNVNRAVSTLLIWGRGSYQNKLLTNNWQLCLVGQPLLEAVSSTLLWWVLQTRQVWRKWWSPFSGSWDLLLLTVLTANWPGAARDQSGSRLWLIYWSHSLSPSWVSCIEYYKNFENLFKHLVWKRWIVKVLEKLNRCLC